GGRNFLPPAAPPPSLISCCSDPERCPPRGCLGRPMAAHDPFDVTRWEVTDEPPTASPRLRRLRLPRRRPGRFLKGPIPWDWLSRAMALRGRALQVALRLWFQSGVSRSRTVLFCQERAAADGIPTTTARRAVRELERAGLVRVVRRPGRGLDVTLLDAPDEAEDSA